LIAGCAKYPPTGSGNGFPLITFSFTVANRLHVPTEGDPSFYLYYVGITASNSLNPDPKLSPQPVVSDSSQNGFMAGSPTHFVLFQSQNPQSAQPFQLFQFLPNSGGTSNPADPTNPINLTQWVLSNRASIVKYVQWTPTQPAPGQETGYNTISFSIFANALADTDADAMNLHTLQVNFLTMNRSGKGSGGTRIIDSIGNDRDPSQINAYVQVSLDTDGIYSNTTGLYSGLEPPNDTLGGADPDVDIVDWSITVTH